MTTNKVKLKLKMIQSMNVGKVTSNAYVVAVYTRAEASGYLRLEE
jgi:hypothetical protein